jgi:HAMP domain-containing protein
VCSSDLRVVWASVALIIILGVLGFFLSRRISKPLENLRNGVERFAKGDLQYKLPLFRTKEISDLAEAMKYMAERLDERIKIIVEQRNELEILLSGMIEGVLAVDTDERVIMLNQAAGRLFGVNPAEFSVVNPLVRGTWIHIFLFVTTIPALMVMLVAGDGIVGFALMFFIQTCVFWTLGRVWALLFSSIAQQKRKNGS